MPKKNTLTFLGALVAAEILSAFELSMLYSALRYLIEDFGNPEAVGWIITSFLLASAVSAAICGRLGDMFGRRQVLLAVIAVSVAGSLISGFSSSLAGVVAGRIIQGAAGAIFPLCIGLVRENTSDDRAPIHIGILAATMTVSAGFGAVLGGVLVDNLSWHWIFFCGAAVGAVAMVLIAIYVPKSRPAGVPKRTNILGGILFAPAIVFILLSVTKSADWGWADTRTVLFLGAGAALMIVWIVSELKAETPLIHVRLLANRQVLLVNLAGAVLGLSAFQFLQVWSILLQQPTTTGIGLGLSATMAGLVMLPMTLMALVGGPAAGWMIARYGGRPTMAIGSLVLSLTWIAVLLKNDSVLFFLGIMIIMGLSKALFYASLPILIARSVPLERTSEASGVMIVIRVTAMGIGAQIVATLLDSSTVKAPAGEGFYPDPTAYMVTLSYIIVGCFLMFFISLMLPRKEAVAKNAATGTVGEKKVATPPLVKESNDYA